MSNLSILIKTNIINEFKLNALKKADGREKQKIMGMMLSVVIIAGLLIFYVTSLSLSLVDILKQINQMEMLLIFGFGLSTLTTIVTSLYKTSSYLFQAKDLDLLTSLPIKESTVLASKILMLVGANYLFSSICMIIPAVVYFLNSDVSITYFPYLILLFLALPLLPIVASSIIFLFIGQISSRIKYKNLVLIIGSIILMLLYTLLMSRLNSMSVEMLKNSVSISEMIRKVYPPIYYFVDALKTGSIVSFLAFIAISIIPFFMFVTLFAKKFKDINAKMSEGYKSKNYEFKGQKTSRPLKALLKKEFKRYTSSFIYFLNSSAGLLFLIVGTILILLFGADKVGELLKLNIDFNLIKIQLLGVFFFIIVMNCTTYCSISLEGKNLWILKSSPIDEREIFWSKILMNFLLNAPLSILCLILVSIRLDFEIQFIIVSICLIVSFSMFVALMGLLSNLLYPNLDWKNEVAVVKRSASMIVTMLVSLAYVIILGGIYVLLGISFLNIYIILASILTLILDFMIWRIISTKGVRIFKNL
ncbi:putative ABC transporter permease subunit [Clostridioides difficile]|uniref:putative ABC transporter permease subunit n=1 Tax=Clostridioides difficile TaxID=1496 RepID=UPI0021C882D1|nr:ABC transporter permease [Clostridioides difficile]UUV12993.1 ABC transporter permease [Clostridioides difficile]